MTEITTSPAAQVIVSIIPLVGIVIGGVVIFFYLLWRNTQIKLLIKSGAYEPARFNLKAFALLTGLLLIAVGLVLTVLILIIDGVSYPLLGGLIPLAIGIALIVFYRIYKNVK